MELKRELNLFRLSLYGLGDILGAGIYALIGKVAAVAGNLIWLSFLMAIGCAIPTALCYAELASRFPKAGGATVFVHQAFGRKNLTRLVGLIVLASGIISSAAIANAFAGYLGALLPISREMAVVGFILVLSLINFIGIRESSWLNVLCVFIEAGGLVLIILLGMKFLGGNIDYTLIPPTENSFLAAGLSGAALAFYACIGFEDMCNLSEEAINPSKNIPRAILIALGLASVIYVLVAITAISVVPFAELAASPAPMALVIERSSQLFKPQWMIFVALFALTNTALANLIMASRLLYGMSNEGWVPKVLSQVHKSRQTPWVAIVVVFVICAAIAWIGNLGNLAKLTNANILSLFFLVNLSLIIVQRTQKTKPSFSVPFWLPMLGALLCLIFFLKNASVF